MSAINCNGWYQRFHQHCSLATTSVNPQFILWKITFFSTAAGEERPALSDNGNNIINLPDYIYNIYIRIYHMFALSALNGQGPRPSILWNSLGTEALMDFSLRTTGTTIYWTRDLFTCSLRRMKYPVFSELVGTLNTKMIIKRRNTHTFPSFSVYTCTQDTRLDIGPTKQFKIMMLLIL